VDADERELFKRGLPAPPRFERKVPVDFTLGFTSPHGFVLVALRESIT
jgi:hypothetical protein